MPYILNKKHHGVACRLLFTSLRGKIRLISRKGHSKIKLIMLYLFIYQNNQYIHTRHGQNVLLFFIYRSFDLVQIKYDILNCKVRLPEFK